MKPRKMESTTAKIAAYFVVVMTLVPLLWLLLLSFKSNNDILLNPLSMPEALDFVNYKNAIDKIPYLTMIKNTLIVVAVTLPVAMLFAVLAAFALSRNQAIRRAVREKYRLLFVCGLIVPNSILILPIYMMMVKFKVWNTLWSLILTFIGWSAPLSIMNMIDAFDSIPDSLEEAAIIDGCSAWQLLFRIMLPLVKPALVTVVIYTFLGIWNDFLLSRVMLNGVENRTISLAAMYFKGQFSTDYALMAAGVMILIVPQILVYVALQKFIVSGSTAGAVKG